MLTFYLVTDTHYYNSEVLGPSDHVDQITLNENGAIIDAAFDKLIAKEDSDIILIAGDLTNNGERESHDGLIPKLRRLKEAGKRVYVITATHDYGLTDITEDGESDRRAGATYRNDLPALYHEFGFQDAIATFEQFSYVVQLAPGYRLLCLNDDGDGRAFCGYYEPQLNWILEQIRLAKEAGDFIFAMTHHPVLPPSPVYPLMSKRDMLGNYENTSTVLADAGLRFIFTGHAHMQSINCKRTERGNRLYDINTGSLSGFPTPIRRVEIDDQAMRITTEHIDHFDWDLQGKTVMQYLSDHVDFLLNDIFDAAANDIDRFADRAIGFSMEPETVYKLEIPITAAGQFLNKLTLGGLGVLCFCPQKIDKSVRNIKVKDLFVELVRNLYAGDEPYSKDTAVGTALLAIAGNLNILGAPFLKNTNLGNLKRLLYSFIYDPTPDNNATLPLRD